MIRGYCRTSLNGRTDLNDLDDLDDFDTDDWPKEFVAVPRKGEQIRSKNGSILKVCKITHYMKTEEFRDVYPAIEVELNK